MTLVFDAILATGIVTVASAALFARDRTASVAAFMVAGLLVALSWVRLGAPDVALAEAAIGAGLTGALLLRSARRLGPALPAPVPRWQTALAALGAVGLAALLGAAALAARGSPVYPPMVAERLAQSGVENPVTAVLLNFRAWDTLLEIAVLFAALMLVALLPGGRVRSAPLGELALPFARVVVPVTVLLAGHLLWQGASAPGGAFQGGAVLAGGLIALGLSGADQGGGSGEMRRAWLVALAGLAVFALAALTAGVLTGSLLGYPAGQAKIWIVAIEAALTLAIAATLTLVFRGLGRTGGAA